MQSMSKIQLVHQLSSKAAVEVFFDRTPSGAISVDEIYETLILDANYPF
jgi:hypothetical protein